jgi:transposase InsO family protein
MAIDQGLSLHEMGEFVRASGGIEFQGQERREVYGWVEAELVRWEYHCQGKKQKGTIRSYMRKVTGLSMPQLTRLIRRHRQSGHVAVGRKPRRRFPSKYTAADFAALARVDEAHQRLSGPATRRILQREWKVFGKGEYERLAEISASHIYNLRRSPEYRKQVIYIEPTRPIQVAIGERRLPDPKGQPGYLRVDTVHQGDQDGSKGVYHINAVDTVTQWEVVGCAAKISERHLIPVLKAILHQFPFRILGFHADNGSEYINHKVAKLLNKLLVEFTKSRAYRTQDNALVEGKNGAVVRKHMGYEHIAGEHAEAIQKFYTAHFNLYLNYHRPCGFATIRVNPKGKRKRVYKSDDYATPYEKLKSLPDAEQYLKKGVTWERLDRLAGAASDTEFAGRVMKAKSELLRHCRCRADCLPPRR